MAEYSGRLAYGDDGFHVDPDGKRVVTEDGGKTWRYATAEDKSHFDRYHERFVGIDSTANRLADLAFEHGLERAEELLRENEPQHFDEIAVAIVQLKDEDSETLTSHTEAKP